MMKRGQERTTQVARAKSWESSLQTPPSFRHHILDWKKAWKDRRETAQRQHRLYWEEETAEGVSSKRAGAHSASRLGAHAGG
jgi:hypothetical protein